MSDNNSKSGGSSRGPRGNRPQGQKSGGRPSGRGAGGKGSGGEPGGYKGKGGKPRSGGGGSRPGGKGRPSRDKSSRGQDSRSRGRSDGGDNRGWSRPRRDPMTNAQAARKAAAMAVTDVLGRGHRVESSLARNPALDGLDARDRAFARAIAAATLRRLGQVNAVLAPLVERPPPGRVQAYLQTATAQMVFMDVAPHAAVGDTVALVKADSKSEPFTGLVNAVLRKVAETGKADAARVPPVQNIPGWLRSEWTRLYGKAAVRRMALLLATAPPLDLSVKADPEGWAEKLGGTLLAGSTVRLDTIGNIRALDGFEEGHWWAQDVAAALPARFLDQACGGVSGKHVADYCAAPGGKTMQLAAMGATVTSIDLSEARTERLTQNLARTKLDATVLTADLTEHQPDSLYDAILLDAPCSATGTFRRHPDVLYNRKERDITPLTRLQDKLLKQAANGIAPGGVLLYSVCSLQEREGAARVHKLVKARPDFRRIPLSLPDGLELPEARLEGGMVRILPPDGSDGRGMDGFFIAALQRSENGKGA